MRFPTPILTLIVLLGLHPALSAQESAKKSTEDKESENPSRTLRIIMAGSRALPAFEKRGSQYVEVDPPLASIPPTSFAFANPKHAPKIKEKSGTQRKISYSAWVNELVRIPSYKSLELLSLHLSRPLISQTDFQQVGSHLGKSLHPLILIRATPSNQGWKKPVSQVIDWNPLKHPAGSILVVNYSHYPIKFYYAKKSIVIAPNRHKHIHRSSIKGKVIRYKVDTTNGKRKFAVANSQYKIEKKSRLIMMALPGIKTASADFPRPNLRLIIDNL